VIEATEVELQNRGVDLAAAIFRRNVREIFGHRLGSWLQQWLRGEAPTVADALVCTDASVFEFSQTRNGAEPKQYPIAGWIYFLNRVVAFCFSAAM